MLLLNFSNHAYLCDTLNFLECRLGVLPLELNKLLIIVVVLSMALTPFLNEVGRWAADFLDGKIEAEDVCF